MTAKVIVAIVAALGLGFAGTYFATGTGGSSCCDGGCPISRLFGLSESQTEVVAPAPSCCGPKSKAPCCDGGEACCDEDAAKAKTEPKTEPVSTPAK